MITLETITKRLENSLNFGLSASPFENISFEFHLTADDGDYLQPRRDGNTVTYYINGLVTETGSTVEGVKEGGMISAMPKINIAKNIHIELLIPLAFVRDNDGYGTVVQYIREYVDGVLGVNTAEYTRDEDDVLYYSTYSYSLANTGLREVRPMVGDSTTLDIDLTAIFIADGVGAASINLTIGGTDVQWERIGIRRTTALEGYVPSLYQNAASRNKPTSTAMTVNVDAPTRLTAFDAALLDYILNGTIDTLSVTISVPNGVNTSGNITREVRTAAHMIFSDASINGERGLGASSSFTLVEVE